MSFSLAFIFAFASISSAAAAPIKITLLSPESSESIFWGKLIKFMQAVAEDLDDVELKIVISNGYSSYALRRDGLGIVESTKRPDYIVTGYWTGAIENMLMAARPHGIKFVIINSDISVSERLKVDMPRVRYPDWIGHMRPDDLSGGYDQAKILINKARKLATINADSLQVTGLGGTEDAVNAIARNAGLKKRLNDDRAVRLNEILITNWHRPFAKEATGKLMLRYPGTNIIWTAADALALGAIDTLKAKGKTPGKDVVVGGFDWSAEGLKAVQKGDLAVTMGGHFMEAGWAVLLIYDYHHGIDFANDTGTSIVTPLYPITSENIDSYLRKLGDQDWRKIDFKKFSKKHNPDIEKYQFSLEALLDSIEE